MKRVIPGLMALFLLPLLSGCGMFEKEPMKVTVLLSDSAGLFEGNDVGILGIPVGKVVSIEPQGDNVAIELEITDPDVSVPEDAGAAVVARSVATDRYIELTPAYTEGPKLASGTTIPVERTATPVDFDQVLASVNDFGSGLMESDPTKQNLKKLVELAAGTLGGNGEKFNRTIRSMTDAVSSIESKSDDIVGTMTSLDKLTGVLVKDEATLRTFIENVAVAMEFLASERTDMGAALNSLSKATDDVSSFVMANRDSLHESLTDVRTVLANIVESREDVEATLDVLPLALDNIERASGPYDAIRGFLDPLVLTQVGPQLDAICRQLNGVCNLVGVPTLGDIFGLLALQGAQ